VSDLYQPEPHEQPEPRSLRAGPPLPEWLAKALLEPDEKPEWVRGPNYAPPWERALTHPLAFLVALPPAVILVTVGRLLADDWRTLHPAFGVSAILVLIGSILVIAFMTAYYTRLVVTERRLLIIQGQSAIRSWGMGDLPPSLLHFGRQAFDGKDAGPRIDLDKLEKMLGGKSEGVIGSDAIIKFGKQLDRIKGRRPD